MRPGDEDQEGGHFGSIVLAIGVIALIGAGLLYISDVPLGSFEEHRTGLITTLVYIAPVAIWGGFVFRGRNSSPEFLRNVLMWGFFTTIFLGTAVWHAIVNPPFDFTEDELWSPGDSEAVNYICERDPETTLYVCKDENGNLSDSFSVTIVKGRK